MPRAFLSRYTLLDQQPGSRQSLVGNRLAAILGRDSWPRLLVARIDGVNSKCRVQDPSRERNPNETESNFRQDVMMAANSPKKSQAKIFANSQLAMAILLMALLAGCGGQQAEVPEDTNSPSESIASEATSSNIQNTNPEASGLSSEGAGGRSKSLNRLQAPLSYLLILSRVHRQPKEIQPEPNRVESSYHPMLISRVMQPVLMPVLSSNLQRGKKLINSQSRPGVSL